MVENTFYYDTPIGIIGISEIDGSITKLCFGRNSQLKEQEMQETPLLQKAAMQLNEYFKGERTSFDLPLSPKGTEFEIKCWNALLTIPYGQTRSYAEQAVIAGNPKASRAVGRANGLNPIAIFIPCHRVIGADGSLTGFAGGLEIKKKLLDLERSNTVRDLFS